MLDNDNIITTNVSEAVEKIPTDEKNYRKCSFIVFYLAQPQQTNIHYNIANSRNCCLPTRIHPVQLQELQKTFYINLNRKRSNNWHMISFIRCGSEKRVYRFPSDNRLADGCIITL